MIKDEGEEKVLNIEGGIFPVTNSNMLNLIHYSVRDILLTGDQSITDMFSCCSDKNLFYQKAPWKRSLASNLSKALPNKYLSSVKTSCGTINAIRYNSKYFDFVETWDFRKMAKSRLDSVFAGAIALNQGKFQKLYDLFTSKSTLGTIKKNVGNAIRDEYLNES